MIKNVIIVVLVLVVGYLVYTQYYIPTPKVTESETEVAKTTPTQETICAQVITPAINPDTKEIKEFPTPCDVPKGWDVIENDVPGLDLEVQ
jgi:hypothetical protein